jgi:hypothetical protein
MTKSVLSKAHQNFEAIHGKDGADIGMGRTRTRALSDTIGMRIKLGLLFYPGNVRSRFPWNVGNNLQTTECHIPEAWRGRQQARRKHRIHRSPILECLRNTNMCKQNMGGKYQHVRLGRSTTKETGNGNATTNSEKMETSCLLEISDFSRKLRLRCSCQFSWCALSLTGRWNTLRAITWCPFWSFWL